MRNWLNNYFGFTKREYNGLLALMVLLLVISVLPYVYTTFWIKPAQVSNEEQAAIQKLILVNQQEPNYYAKMRNQVEDSEANTTTTLFKCQKHLFLPSQNRHPLSNWNNRQ